MEVVMNMNWLKRLPVSLAPQTQTYYDYRHDYRHHYTHHNIHYNSLHIKPRSIMLHYVRYTFIHPTLQERVNVPSNAFKNVSMFMHMSVRKHAHYLLYFFPYFIYLFQPIKPSLRYIMLNYAHHSHACYIWQCMHLYAHVLLLILK